MGYMNLKLSPNDPLIICLMDEGENIILDPKKISVINLEYPAQLAFENDNDFKYLRYKALCKQIRECRTEERGPLIELKDIVDEKLSGLEGSL